MNDIAHMLPKTDGWRLYCGMTVIILVLLEILAAFCIMFLGGWNVCEFFMLQMFFPVVGAGMLYAGIMVLPPAFPYRRPLSILGILMFSSSPFLSWSYSSFHSFWLAACSWCFICAYGEVLDYLCRLAGKLGSISGSHRLVVCADIGCFVHLCLFKIPLYLLLGCGIVNLFSNWQFIGVQEQYLANVHMVTNGLIQLDSSIPFIYWMTFVIHVFRAMAMGSALISAGLMLWGLCLLVRTTSSTAENAVSE